MVQKSTALTLQNSLFNTNFAKAEEYFNDLEKAKEAKRYTIINDELYVKTHRGTYTMEDFVKKANRQCEVLLINVDFFLVSYKVRIKIFQRRNR